MTLHYVITIVMVRKIIEVVGKQKLAKSSYFINHLDLFSFNSFFNLPLVLSRSYKKVRLLVG